MKCGNYYKLKFHNETFKNSGILFELVRKNRCSSSHISRVKVIFRFYIHFKFNYWKRNSSRKLSILMLFERIFYNAVPIRSDFIEVIQNKT
ncbi:hypothetical protein LEP1GSC170_1712 [Leptospira interrogans serovar Bataviae str. HAI135]|nr:hypothetical protein LEP1GSC170_1712 [Leptospira interrogans serovar Bataviae str. HAI135]